MNMRKANAISGTIYLFLAVAFVAVAVLGAIYMLDPIEASRPFLIEPGRIITKGDAGQAMIPVGVLMAIGLAGFGTVRMRAVDTCGEAL